MDRKYQYSNLYLKACRPRLEVKKNALDRNIWSKQKRNIVFSIVFDRIDQVEIKNLFQHLAVIESWPFLSNEISKKAIAGT